MSVTFPVKFNQFWALKMQKVTSGWILLIRKPQIHKHTLQLQANYKWCYTCRLGSEPHSRPCLSLSRTNWTSLRLRNWKDRGGRWETLHTCLVSTPDIYRDCFYNAAISQKVLLVLLQISPNDRCSWRSPISNHILQAALWLLSWNLFHSWQDFSVITEQLSQSLDIQKLCTLVWHTRLNPGLTSF